MLHLREELTELREAGDLPGAWFVAEGDKGERRRARWRGRGPEGVVQNGPRCRTFGPWGVRGTPPQLGHHCAPVHRPGRLPTLLFWIFLEASLYRPD